jgi:hypothetical protein
MNATRCREWLDLCAGVAQQTLQVSGQPPVTDWIRPQDEFFSDPIQVAALGFLLQWACEDGETYATTFRQISPSEQALCPFHHEGVDFAVNVVRNGVMDDWEIFAHWGPGGYVLVPEWQRQDADRRFNSAWAPDWLYRRCGGVRNAASLPQECRDALHIRAIELASNSEQLADDETDEEEIIAAPACR